MGKIIAKGKCLWDFYVTGKAVILDHTDLPQDAYIGGILIVRSPSPDIVIYMNSALGVVAETGGTLCHAAVLAMELGCPIIVAADGISQKIKEGDRISIEGINGEGIIYEATV